MSKEELGLPLEAVPVADVENVATIRQERQRPYYASVDDSKEQYKNSHDFNNLHLDHTKKPTLRELVHTCLSQRKSEHVLFEQGMWVEYLSNDMEWKVGVVNRVIKQPPDDWDFDEKQEDPPEHLLEISYNIGVEGVVEEDNIRAPRLGLQAIFGMRPWLWQQFTLLQLEKRLRFDQNHEYDFEEIDNVKFARSRYDAWLNTVENADFKELHDQQPPVAQKLLRSHLIVPFDLMDFIVERPKEWDFNDPDISVYTYTGVLGSGSFMLLSTLTIQLLTPLLLLYNNIYQTDLEPSDRFFVDEIIDNEGNLEAVVSQNGNFLPGTDFTLFCKRDEEEAGRVEGKILIGLVLLIYLSTVVPDSILGFYRTSGGYKSTYSKINSLRNIIWEQNDDDFWQEIGFKVDRMMNTGYIATLYMMMLFILLNTPLILDLILNALAIEFIHQIDERIADADWWDGDNRWIKAGTIELVIQGTLRLRVLESATRICQEYDISRDHYKEALGGMKSLHSAIQARRDDNDERYATDREVLFEQVARKAEEENDDFVVQEYRKQIVSFGAVEYVGKFFGRTQGLFNRYEKYRVWSRWEKVLFLPRLPPPKMNIDDFSTLGTNVELGQDDTREFVSHVIRVMTGKDMYQAVKKSIKHRYFLQAPRKVFLGILEWFLYFTLLLFPFVIAAGLIFIPFCY